MRTKKRKRELCAPRSTPRVRWFCCTRSATPVRKTLAAGRRTTTSGARDGGRWAGYSDAMVASKQRPRGRHRQWAQRQRHLRLIEQGSRCPPKLGRKLDHSILGPYWQHAKQIPKVSFRVDTV